MDMNPQGNDPIKYVGMPPALNPSITDTKHWFQALDNFCRFMAIRQGDRVLMLTDPLLDPRVIDAFTGLAASRGATLSVYMAPNTQLPGIPEELKPLIQQASFIVSTWFCSIEDPFNVAMRKAGQRWVKITYFKDYFIEQILLGITKLHCSVVCYRKGYSSHVVNFVGDCCDLVPT